MTFEEYCAENPGTRKDVLRRAWEHMHPQEADAMNRQRVIRFAMPFDEAGVIITSQLDSEHTLTKRKRRVLVSQVAKMLRIWGTIPANVEVLSVGKVIDALGNLQFEVILTEKTNES